MKEIKSGDVFVSKKYGNGIVVHHMGELQVIFKDMWYPLGNFKRGPEEYDVVKVVRPSSYNMSLSEALFKNKTEELEVIYTNDFKEKFLREGMGFSDGKDWYHVYQVGCGAYKLFRENSFNRKNDNEYIYDEHKVKDVLKDNPRFALVRIDEITHKV